MVLRRAAEAVEANTRKTRPSASTAGGALLALEKEQKKNRAQTKLEDLVGQWELTLTASGKPNKKGLFDRPVYFPITTRQTFIPDSGAGDGAAPTTTGIFDNCIYFAGCELRFFGPYRWERKRNLLLFTAATCVVKVGPLGSWTFDDIDKGGSEIATRTAKTLPFFTFFYAKNGIAAARGRGGGVALYRRVPPGKEL